MRRYKLKNNPATIYYCYEDYDTHREVYIDLISTPRDFRRQGHARNLLTRFTKTMSKYDRIYMHAAESFGSTLEVLIPFYESMGFTIKDRKLLYAEMEIINK